MRAILCACYLLIFVTRNEWNKGERERLQVRNQKNIFYPCSLRARACSDGGPSSCSCSSSSCSPCRPPRHGDQCRHGPDGKRDLKADRANVMTEASKLKPVVIDESLTDQEALMLAREMGYTGVALKACKSQSQALLMAAVAQKYKMFLCVQDLTCPGASLLHSAGISAHIPGVAAIEANGRQYCPAANEPWVKKFPDIFIVKDGTMGTACLNKPGLGVVD